MKDRYSMNPFSVMAWVLALAGIIVWLFTAGAAGVSTATRRSQY